MLHSLDSPLSVNSSPVAFNDFTKTSIDDDEKYNSLNESSIYDLDFLHFDIYDEMNSILSVKDDFSSASLSNQNNNNNNNNSTYGFLPQMNFQSNLAFDPMRSDFGDELNKENENAQIEKNERKATISSEIKLTDIKKKTPKVSRKKPIVLRPFVSVWAVEMCVKKLKEFQEGVSSDDQE